MGTLQDSPAKGRGPTMASNVTGTDVFVDPVDVAAGSSSKPTALGNGVPTVTILTAPPVSITRSGAGTAAIPTMPATTIGNEPAGIVSPSGVRAPPAAVASPGAVAPGTAAPAAAAATTEIRSAVAPGYAPMANDSAASSPFTVRAPMKQVLSGPTSPLGAVISPIKPAAAAAAAAPAAGATAAAAGGQKPPPASAVLKEAVRELQESGSVTLDSVKSLVVALKNKQTINVTLDQLVQALFYLFLGFQLLLIKLLRPSAWWLFVFSIVGLLLGLGFSFMFYHNKKKKAESCDVLGTNVGMKGLQYLVGTLPSWLNYTEREKVNWLNAVLEEVWPYYDKGVCKEVKRLTDEVFAQTLSSMKVPGIKSIRFKHLTFGDAPFRVESIHVSDKYKNALVLEVDVRWCGDANITLAVELAVGEFAKMCPKVTDISFAGSLRIMLCPLVDTIPGFGAAVVTFRKRPRYKYSLNFGKALGGQYAANVVKPFINYVLDTMIISSFIWPQRLVVPILNTEQMQFEVEKLSYRHQGLLKVTVVQATDLINTDLVGKSDPLVELTTDSKHTVSTKCLKNTCTPHWNETFYLLVQEPTSQEMFVTVYDKDLFSAKELLTLNLGQTFGSKELMGRVLVKLAPITAQEGEPLTKWYHLGMGDWSNPEGCGKGFGRIQLSCVYRSLASFTMDEVGTAKMGSVVVKIREARNMPRAPNRRTAPMSVFVRVKCGDGNTVTGTVTSKGPQHFFRTQNVLEFHNVLYSKDVGIKLFEKSVVGPDLLHELLLPINTVADCQDRNPLSGQRESGLMLRQFKLSGGVNTGEEETDLTKPALYAEVRYVPYF